MRWPERALDELAWLAFSVPRQTLEALARRLPLAALRDRLPRVIARRLRQGLYPLRLADAPAVTCARAQPAWGEPAALDPARPVRYEGAPRVSILVLSYGNLALTRLCLASLQRSAGATPFELIVVDNASEDGTVEWLRAQAERGLLPLSLLLNRENLGFAGANNRAAARARGEIVVFLNNDTVVTPGWLERLVAHLDRDPSVGMVGPVTNSCGNRAALGTPYADLDAMLEHAESYTGARPLLADDIDMLTLFCAAMPLALFRAVGGLDERYRVGMFEDDDLSMSVKARGRRLLLARDVFVHHYGGAAFSQLARPRYLRVWWENRRRFEAKWGMKWQPR